LHPIKSRCELEQQAGTKMNKPLSTDELRFLLSLEAGIFDGADPGVVRNLAHRGLVTNHGTMTVILTDLGRAKLLRCQDLED
jgi:hypothetical protein